MIALEGGPVHVWKEVKILCVQGGVKGVKEAWGEGINRKRMGAIKGVVILMKIKEQKGGFFFPTPFNGKNIALWGSGSQLGMWKRLCILPLRTLGTVWRHFCQNSLATGIEWAQARGSAKHPTVYVIDSHAKELSSPKCHWWQGREALL